MQNNDSYNHKFRHKGSNSKQMDRESNDKRRSRIKELEKRLCEIEDWLMENPFNHPDFEKMVEERNQILVRI